MPNNPTGFLVLHTGLAYDRIDFALLGCTAMHTRFRPFRPPCTLLAFPPEACFNTCAACGQTSTEPTLPIPSRNLRPPGPAAREQTYASPTGRGTGTGAGDEHPAVRQEHLAVGLTTQVNTNPPKRRSLPTEPLYAFTIHRKPGCPCARYPVLG